MSFSGRLRTTTTVSSSDSPGHANFITRNILDNPYDWRSPQNAALWQSASSATNPCPSGYRIPTEAEFLAETVAFLKLGFTGQREPNGVLNRVGTMSYNWVSNISGTTSKIIEYDGILYSGGLGSTNAARVFGSAVRCIAD
jgi:hypothetical protein